MPTWRRRACISRLWSWGTSPSPTPCTITTPLMPEALMFSAWGTAARGAEAGLLEGFGGGDAGGGARGAPPPPPGGALVGDVVHGHGDDAVALRSLRQVLPPVLGVVAVAVVVDDDAGRLLGGQGVEAVR